MKKVILAIIFLIITMVFIFNFKHETKLNNTKFNVYLKSGSTYEKSDLNEFPKSGYILNETETTCDNGSIVTQNPISKAINISFSKSDKCNLYYDPESEQTLNKLHSLNNDITLKSSTPDFSKISPLPTEYQDGGISSSESSWSPPLNTSYMTYADSYTFNTSTGIGFD